MPLVVNSNISSLNAQRQLTQAGSELDKASERLASGKRINSAADDAAGLAISNRQTSQIRGLDQAIRNSNDGISLIQTAEGALDETTNILQRMRELSVQSSNGIYSDADRSTLNAEVSQLKSEIDRIAESTSFNGKTILDGSLGKVDLQVGALANQTISFEVGKLDSSGLGGADSGDIVGAAVDLSAGVTMAGAVTINGQTVAAADLTASTNTQEVLDTLNNSVSGVEFAATTRFEADSAGTGVLRNGDTMTIAVTNTDGTSSSLSIGGTGNMDELVAKINAAGGDDISASLTDDGKLVVNSASGAKLAMTSTSNSAVGLSGVAATDTGNAQLSMTSTDGKDITVAYGAAADALVLGIDARTDAGDVSGSRAVADLDAVELLEGQIKINGVDIGAAASTSVADIVSAINEKSSETGVVASGVSGGVLSLNSVNDTEISIEVGKTAGGAATLGALGFQETNTSKTSGESIANVDISTAAGAQKAITTIDTALEQINDTRAELGAVNNRLDFTVSNLSNVSENTSAARSRIVDADFAAETAALSRGQVLQQASQAMLAQANARPQQVLSLLQ